MVKRKCGTCRHFSDGGVAGSGWCQHPARRDLQHMVLVRKSELACRNGWDQDLWEMGAETVGSGASLPSDQFSSPAGGAPGFSPDMIPDPTIVDANVGEIFTDKIQSIGLSVRPVESTRADERAPVVSVEHDHAALDSRSVVREARRRRQEQRSQDQRRHQQALADAAGAMLDQPGQPESVTSTRSAHPSTSPLTEPPAPPRRVPIGEIRRPAHHRGIPSQVARKVGSGEDRDTDEWIEVKSSADRFRAPKSPEPEITERRREIDGGTEPLPIEQLREEMAADSGRPAEVRVDVPGSLPTFVDPPIPPRETVWITGAGAIGASRFPIKQDIIGDDAAQEPRLPLAMPRDPVDASQFASSVPRCCATCRDFKRVGDGARGWCVNLHAFIERRMVESDGISCRSSLGTWWLPSDDLWLERVDMTHHGRPTPLLDQLHGDDLIEGHEMESRPF